MLKLISLHSHSVRLIQHKLSLRAKIQAGFHVPAQEKRQEFTKVDPSRRPDIDAVNPYPNKASAWGYSKPNHLKTKPLLGGIPSRG
jgi:hypothetical protein